MTVSEFRRRVLRSADFSRIEKVIADSLEDYDLARYPFDIWHALNVQGYRATRYSLLPENVRNTILDKYPDALTLRRKGLAPSGIEILYNDDRSEKRIRFSLAHELGHIWLGHPDQFSNQAPELVEMAEAEANFFAGYLLAPTALVLSLELNTPQKIANYFDISLEAAKLVQERVAKHAMWPLSEVEKKILALTLQS